VRGAAAVRERHVLQGLGYPEHASDGIVGISVGVAAYDSPDEPVEEVVRHRIRPVVREVVDGEHVAGGVVGVAELLQRAGPDLGEPLRGGVVRELRHQGVVVRPAHGFARGVVNCALNVARHRIHLALAAISIAQFRAGSQNLARHPVRRVISVNAHESDAVYYPRLLRHAAAAVVLVVVLRAVHSDVGQRTIILLVVRVLYAHVRRGFGSHPAKRIVRDVYLLRRVVVGKRLH
jgi:hypothetical protein